ncbi:MAG: diguanylate cyclase [Proteobacteria bacterium]|nr:diguanylate cyclase [Pseudomonadota bacterium]
MSDEIPNFRILIVDDLPDNIKLAAHCIQKEGHEVAFATSGMEALDLLEKSSFDLILLDIMMPTMDGFEVCAKLKENPDTRDIPIIFLTAKTDAASIVKGLEMGSVDYVTKPFDIKVLLARVKTHLELKYSKELLKKQSTTDDLTKILNRRGFLRSAKDRLQFIQRLDSELYLLFVDLDDMKWINDELGHSYGDIALVEVVEIFKETFRKSDLIGRIGGDEFAVLGTREVGSSSASRILQRLEDKATNHNQQPNRKYLISLSVGIVKCDTTGKLSLEEMMADADKEMYQHKQDKRAKFRKIFSKPG